MKKAIHSLSIMPLLAVTAFALSSCATQPASKCPEGCKKAGCTAKTCKPGCTKACCAKKKACPAGCKKACCAKKKP